MFGKIMKDYQKREIFFELERLFFDTSKRPKKTPLYESIIKRNLEEKYSLSEISYALKKLESVSSKKQLKKITKKLEPIGNVNFYYPNVLETFETKSEIEKKIRKISGLIKKYSNKKITEMIGNHLHNLVKNELEIKKFEIIGEHTNKYHKKEWSDTQHTLDIIATNKLKNLTIGVEVKNTLDDISKKEVDVKIDMCKTFGIVPVFACRFTHYKKYINKKGGFCWDFKHQIYPINKMNFVKPLQGRLNLPILALSEIPEQSRLVFEDWLKQY